MKAGVKLCIGLILGACIHTAAYAKSEVANNVCAAFSSAGAFANATISGSSLVVQVATQSGSTFELRMKAVSPGNACRAFFSKDSQLLAVSVESTLRAHAPVQVAVASVLTGKWLQPAIYTPSIAEAARGPLQGFFKDTHTLIVMSRGYYESKDDLTTVYPEFVELPEGAVQNIFFHLTGQPPAMSTGVADISGDRIWFLSNRDRCGFQTIIIDREEATVGPTIEGRQLRAAGCGLPELFFPLSPKSAVVGFPKENQYVIATVDTKSGAVRTVSIPQKGRYDFLMPSKSAVTADSRYFAVQFMRYANGHQSVSDVVIFKEEPFGVVQTLHVRNGMRMLAMDDNDSLRIAIVDSTGHISLLKVAYDAQRS